VQHFLITINNNPNAFSPPIPTVPEVGGKFLTTDGVAGPITFRAIKHFQEVARTRGNNIATDGRVDKATGGGVGATLQTTFTIIFLNNAYRVIRPGSVQNISFLAGDLPSELRPVFSLV
jgi:hypothetical protein